MRTSLHIFEAIHVVRRCFLHGFFALLVVTTLAACGNSPEATSEANTSDAAVQEVGFDLDDTLVFSSPAFEHAFEQDVEPFSEEFWGIVNSSDAEYSCIKTTVVDILEKHQRKGREIYIITAREPENTQPTRNFVHNQFDVPKDHLYFEPDGKTKRLEQLGIDIYYGDSNSDITDAKKGDIKSIRIERNPESSYDDNYNPGKFGEKVLENTASHRCR